MIVVDDGSSDDTVALAERSPAASAVLTQSNLGPGPARNLGVAHARGEILAFTDSDCFPSPEWLREGVAAIAQADLVQGAVLPDPEAEMRAWDRTIWVTGLSGLWETANLFVRSDLFERLGGFEDWMPVSIGKPMAEDVWLGWRAVRASARCEFCEGALVHHAVFRRGPRGYVWERARLMYFPVMVRKMPEIRESFCYRRYFMSRHTAEFDLAVLGLLAAAVLRSPIPLAAGVPYTRFLAGRRRRVSSEVAASDLVADAFGCAALVWGSLRSRTPVL